MTRARSLHQVNGMSPHWMTRLFLVALLFPCADLFAESKDAPVLLLLHGLPSSSRMFEPLLARLADRFHLIAPDYPGFGHTLVR